MLSLHKTVMHYVKMDLAMYKAREKVLTSFESTYCQIQNKTLSNGPTCIQLITEGVHGGPKLEKTGTPMTTCLEMLCSSQHSLGSP